MEKVVYKDKPIEVEKVCTALRLPSPFGSRGSGFRMFAAHDVHAQTCGARGNFGEL